MYYNDYLKHYGVLGMHWGQRKAEGGVTTSRQADRAMRTTPSEDSRRKVAIQRKKVAAMTNAELKQVNERLQLETTYNNLNKSKMSIGKRFKESIIGKQVNTSAKSYVAQSAAKIIAAAVGI